MKYINTTYEKMMTSNRFVLSGEGKMKLHVVV